MPPGARFRKLHMSRAWLGKDESRSIKNRTCRRGTRVKNYSARLLSGTFDAVADVFRANFEAGEELGAGFAVWLEGEIVAEMYGGWADRERSRPFDDKTLTPVYSVTKGVSALILAEAVSGLDGGYESPVAAIWPEFAAAGKEAVTIGQLASHQAGLPGFADPVDPEIWMHPAECAQALAELAPLWPPGSAHGYHPLSWGYLVGEIVQRITGQSLGTRLRERLCKPEGIDFWIGLPEREHARCAGIKRPGAMPDFGEINAATRAAFLEKWSAPKRGGADWRRIEIPSANGHGTARALAELFSHYTGRPSPIPVTADLIASRTRGQDLVLPMETSFAAGIMLNSHGLFGPNSKTLGHSGWGGAMAIADPDLGLSCAYIMNKQSPILVGDPRAVRLVEAVYSCL